MFQKTTRQTSELGIFKDYEAARQTLTDNQAKILSLKQMLGNGNELELAGDGLLGLQIILEEIYLSGLDAIANIPVDPLEIMKLGAGADASIREALSHE